MAGSLLIDMSGGPMPEPPPVTFACTLNRAQARALAELCKRIGWRDCKELSASEPELYAMLSATDCIRAALADVGVDVR